ncbi:hypothetical protein HGM15179_016119 [Zosterops borbonicus]|uniref:Uncharacterized protein n=1 Tax=Zosterops borbonicus TaxID=364589 RepID=A0A8K1G3S8_9PASS|nr:hypothetical protein HGM15179_016119 [Zosterops borbonicus]
MQQKGSECDMEPDLWCPARLKMVTESDSPGVGAHHRIPDKAKVTFPGSSGMEKTSVIIQSNLCLTPPCPQPRALSATSRNSLDTSRDGHSKPPWAVPRPDHLFHGEIFPKIHPEPPLAQSEAIPSPPVPVPWD